MQTFLLSPSVTLVLMGIVALLGYWLSFYAPRKAGALLLAFSAWATVEGFVWFALTKSGEVIDPLWVLDMGFAITAIFTLLLWLPIYTLMLPLYGANRFV